jgi:S-layer protein (TIGR01564 family)
MLRFAVGKNTSSSVTSKANVYGGYGIGAVTNLENVSVYNITANVTLGTKNYSISGISNLTATPSINTAIQPTLLKNLSTQPLVVLDSQANPNTNLILIGSGYVNILSQALQKQYNITVTNSTQIVQAEGTNRILIAGYTANQTTAAGNSFIEELYASASSSS